MDNLAVINSASDVPTKKYVDDSRPLASFRVIDYGAVGNDTADDHNAVQAALDAAHAHGGGFVDLDASVYRIVGSLTWYSSVTIRGVAKESSILHFTSTTMNGIVGDGLSSCNLDNVWIKGPGQGVGTGIGVRLTYGSNGNNPYHNWTSTIVSHWGSHGIYIQTAIVCNFENVISMFNGGDGFFWPEGSTSCTFNNCFARENLMAGYHWYQSVYQSLNGCASDNNGINYLLEETQAIGFFSCGSEGARRNGGAYDGYGWKIVNSSVITIDGCWVFDNRNIGIWITSSAQGIAIRCADNGPNATAVNFIKVDAGCSATIYELHNTSPNSLAAGTTVVINDGGGGISGQNVFVQSSTPSSIPFFNANRAVVSSTATWDDAEKSIASPYFRMPNPPTDPVHLSNKAYVDEATAVAMGVSGIWRWVATAVTSTPAQGKIGVNKDTVGLATALWIHKQTDTSTVDFTQVLSSLRAGDTIYIQDKADAASWGRWELAGTAAASGNGFSLPISTLAGSAQGTEPNSNSQVLVQFGLSGAMAAGEVEVGTDPASALPSTEWYIATDEDPLVAVPLDHNDLPGRSAADAHPISAVTGLGSALAAKASTAYVNSRTPQVTVGTTAPPSPAVGDLWVDSSP